MQCVHFMSRINIGLFGMAKGQIKCSLQTLPTRGTGSMLQPYVRVKPLSRSRKSTLNAPAVSRLSFWFIHYTVELKELL